MRRIQQVSIEVVHTHHHCGLKLKIKCWLFMYQPQTGPLRPFKMDFLGKEMLLAGSHVFWKFTSFILSILL